MDVIFIFPSRRAVIVCGHGVSSGGEARETAHYTVCGSECGQLSVVMLLYLRAREAHADFS